MKIGENGKERTGPEVSICKKQVSQKQQQQTKRENVTDERVQENFPEVKDTSGPVEKAHCMSAQGRKADPQQGTSL